MSGMGVNPLIRAAVMRRRTSRFNGPGLALLAPGR